MKNFRLILTVIILLFLAGGMIVENRTTYTPPAAMKSADGSRTLTGPPPSAPSGPSAGNPASYRYVTTYWAQDLNRFNLSKPINSAANRYHLSPVGILAIVLSECNGYTQSPRCDRYGAWPDWSHGACQVSVATAGQFGVGYGTEASDAYVKSYENNPTKCIWLAARVLRNFKNASGDSFPLLAADWNCGSSRYVYTEPQCYQNHQAFLSWWNVASRFGTNTKTRATSVEKPRVVGYDLLDNTTIEARLWRVAATRVIESSTVGEEGLTGGFYPLRDTDVMVPQWTHQRIYLPGGTQDGYLYRGCWYLSGSGYASLWLTPTDQYFAILHMVRCPFGGVQAGPPISYQGPIPAGQDDATGAAFSALMKRSSTTKLSLSSGLRKVHGGSFIGLSGWPSSYQYSNGSCYSDATCGIDAHECLILTQGASDWFLWLASGHDLAKPKPRTKRMVFHVKVWNTYVVLHHRAHVNAFRQIKGKYQLRPEARYWFRHQKALGYVTAQEKWHKPKRGIGYEVMPFTRAHLLYWPKNGHFKTARR